MKIEVLDIVGRTVIAAAASARSRTAAVDPEPAARAGDAVRARPPHRRGRGARQLPHRRARAAAGAGRRDRARRHHRAGERAAAAGRGDRLPRLEARSGLLPPADRPGWRRAASSPPISTRSRASARRLAMLDAAAHKLSEAHGRRGERVALRNVLVPAGTAQVYLVAAADYGWNADAALRRARARRAAQGGRRGGAERRRRARPGRHRRHRPGLPGARRRRRLPLRRRGAGRADRRDRAARARDSRSWRSPTKRASTLARGKPNGKGRKPAACQRAGRRGRRSDSRRRRAAARATPTSPTG